MGKRTSTRLVLFLLRDISYQIFDALFSTGMRLAYANDTDGHLRAVLVPGNGTDEKDFSVRQYNAIIHWKLSPQTDYLPGYAKELIEATGRGAWRP